MFRTMSRVVVVAVVLFSFAILCAPVAQARPLDGRPSVRVTQSWLDAALAWMNSLLNGSGADQPKSSVAASGIPIGSGEPITHPMTGSCIDPEGRPRPCYL
jgi:hypothetical protein